ncbi:OX-2 membrane glycoprotein-like isoform X2 [Takifugu rubripes]|uniref:OX-2 membrane glycoprotein-like isoform X1 n=1 Tax=Takifugu rubripes TaxID=31033 RepID=UPI0011454C03|nr:OX-2 membrane glycoprotein-like isoform X1 [Takifugu rubripes]XP_011604554.2 OX-2 membrane glycoprotein-like isoform X1 [Takifugu rubripes]XP_011604555.2 OX-2 membrane glycoprotein-like isoform X2 [Takifugu rubripes]
MWVQILIFSVVLQKAVESLISGFGNRTAGYGGEAYYGCAVSDLPGVLQVTWQRLAKDERVENLATYSKRFGQQVNEPYQGKMVFTEASLSSTVIKVKNVTWEDESCYICSFNAYPDGSKRRQSCLKVKGISEVTTAVHTSNTEHEEEAVEVTFTCSATGKPPPTIQWDLSSRDLNDSQAQTTTLTNSDSTFTSSGNISLRVPSGWKGYVDCLVNSGMVGERRERIPLALDPRRKKKDHADSFPKHLFILVIAVVFISFILVVAVTLWKKRLKKFRRPEIIL